MTCPLSSKVKIIGGSFQTVPLDPTKTLIHLLIIMLTYTYNSLNYGTITFCRTKKYS